MAEKNQYSHKHYTYVKDEKEADAVAWAFLNKDEMVKFPHKFEELPEDQIRVNITHTGLCHSDVLTARSLWGPANYPIVPGHEIIGTVSRVGKAVKNLKVGDRVGYGPFRDCCEQCRHCEAGRTNLCVGVPADEKGIYAAYWGGYTTSTQHPARLAFKIPEALPSDKAPPLLCAGVTVHAPLARYAKPGDRVAVLGIGGLGHLAVMYAHKFGCRVTAFSSSAGKEKLIKDLGADEVVSSTDPEVLKKHASSYDVIINTLSTNDNKVFGLYLNMTDGQGTFVQVGAPPISESFSLLAFQLIAKNIAFVGSMVGSVKETKDMLDFSARHNILPMCEHFEFEDFPKAFDTLENGRPKFRCVVNVENYAKKHNLHKN